MGVYGTDVNEPSMAIQRFSVVESQIEKFVEKHDDDDEEDVDRRQVEDASGYARRWDASRFSIASPNIS